MNQIKIARSRDGKGERLEEDYRRGRKTGEKNSET